MNRQPLELMIRHLERHESTGSLEEAAIRLVLRMQLELDERLTQLEREMARGSDTEPAPPRELCSACDLRRLNAVSLGMAGFALCDMCSLPGESNPAGNYAESWSGAEVVPRGSSRPPSSGVKVDPRLPFNEWPATSETVCNGIAYTEPPSGICGSHVALGPDDFAGSDEGSHYCSTGAFALGPDMTEGGDDK